MQPHRDSSPVTVKPAPAVSLRTHSHLNDASQPENEESSSTRESATDVCNSNEDNSHVAGTEILNGKQLPVQPGRNERFESAESATEDLQDGPRRYPGDQARNIIESPGWHGNIIWGGQTRSIPSPRDYSIPYLKTMDGFQIHNPDLPGFLDLKSEGNLPELSGSIGSCASTQENELDVVIHNARKGTKCYLTPMFDTGSKVNCMTQQIAEELGAEDVDKSQTKIFVGFGGKMVTSNGRLETRVQIPELNLKIKVPFQVVENEALPQHDVLLNKTFIKKIWALMGKRKGETAGKGAETGP